MSDKKQEHISQVTDKEVSIGQRASALAEDLAEINPHNSLNEIVNSMKEECRSVKSVYEKLCKDIEAEVFSILSQINEKKMDSVKIDQELLSKEKEKNRYCSIYAKVPPLKNLKDDSDYNYFFDKYQQELNLSHQISDLNLKLMRFLGIQRKLDDIFASSMIETDYLLRKISDTMKTFKYMKTPDLLDNYKSRYCFYKNLQKMLDEKNLEFETSLKKMDRFLLK